MKIPNYVFTTALIFGILSLSAWICRIQDDVSFRHQKLVHLMPSELPTTLPSAPHRKEKEDSLAIPSEALNRDSAGENIVALEEKYQHWVKTFRAPNPIHQSYCMNTLTAKEGGSSQYGQDLFMFFNLFKYWPVLNKTGFYVDSGANSAEALSNTYFYDVCLGWKGLCVEPNKIYHAELSAKRTCQLIPKCISDKERTVTLNDAGASSKVTSDAGSTPCLPLQTMLSQNPDWDPLRGISLWSLDAEGYELTILSTVDFEKIKIEVLLVEDFCNVRNYARKLSESGFLKYHQLPIDALFVQPSFPLPKEKWYNRDYEKYWNINIEWRKTNAPHPGC